MGELFFGVDIAGVVNQNISPGLPTIGHLRKRVTGTRTPGQLTGGTNPTMLEADATIVVGDYKDHQIDGTLVKTGDRKILVIAESMTVAFVPETDTEIVAEGKTYKVVKVGRDPAGATYSCQVRA